MVRGLFLGGSKKSRILTSFKRRSRVRQLHTQSPSWDTLTFVYGLLKSTGDPLWNKDGVTEQFERFRSLQSYIVKC